MSAVVNFLIDKDRIAAFIGLFYISALLNNIFILNPLFLLYLGGIILYTTKHFASQRHLEVRWSLKIDKVITNLIIGLGILAAGARPMLAVGYKGFKVLILIIFVYSVLVGLYKENISESKHPPRGLMN